MRETIKDLVAKIQGITPGQGRIVVVDDPVAGIMANPRLAFRETRNVSLADAFSVFLAGCEYAGIHKTTDSLGKFDLYMRKKIGTKNWVQRLSDRCEGDEDLKLEILNHYLEFKNGNTTTAQQTSPGDSATRVAPEK
jgi:hypothetical protein